MTLWDVAAEISRRLARIFLRDESGRRPVYGDNEIFQSDPHWRDLVLFYEYFHGENGVGPGGQSSDRVDRAGGEAAAAEWGVAGNAQPPRSGKIGEFLARSCGFSGGSTPGR